MYEIKPKRPGYLLYTIIGLLCLAAVGIGIGYASVRLSKAPTKEDFIKQITSPIPEKTAIPVEEPTDDVLNHTYDITDEKSGEFMYLLKFEDGKTKVYNLFGENQVYSHDIPVEPGSLPQSDLDSLKSGIYLKNKDELMSAIEDFCS